MEERTRRAEEAYAEPVQMFKSITLQRTARHKCAVVARVMGAMSRAAQRRVGEPLGSDDLLPLLSWALARARLPALLAQLGFVQTLLPERLMAQADGFTFASLAGAVHALKQVAESLATSESDSV